MDRSIVYSGELPRSTDFLFAQRASMIAIAKLAKVMLGTATWLEGLDCTPGTGLTVSIAKGQIYASGHVDDTAYGILPADTANTILKQGVVLGSTVLNVPAPGTAGQSINYLVEIGYQDIDGSPLVLPYYNSVNPSQPLSGMNNTGNTQNTVRAGACVVQVKAGTAAATGSQTTPTPDAGFVGAWVVTIANGASSVVTGNISMYPNAPFLPSAGTFSALQANTPCSAADTGSSANAYVAKLTPNPASISDNLRVTISTTRVNSGPATLALNGGSPVAIKSIYTGAVAPLLGGEIVATMNLVYNAAASAWILLNPFVPTVQGADIASASSINVQAVTGRVFNISGTAAISTIVLNDGQERWARATGAFSLVNSSGLQVLPSLASTTVAVGDMLKIVALNGVVYVIIYKSSGSINQLGPFATTSGTSVDISGISSRAKRITITFLNTSTSGTSDYLLQLGSSGAPVTSGYTSNASSGSTTSGSSSGLICTAIVAGASTTMAGVITLVNSGGNVWTASGNLAGTSNSVNVSGGTVDVGAVLDFIRLTTVGGANTFDAGAITVLWE